VDFGKKQVLFRLEKVDLSKILVDFNFKSTYFKPKKECFSSESMGFFKNPMDFLKK
jgi:hypothetical protein